MINSLIFPAKTVTGPIGSSLRNAELALPEHVEEGSWHYGCHVTPESLGSVPGLFLSVSSDGFGAIPAQIGGAPVCLEFAGGKHWSNAAWPP
jgi:hypothetical protein